VYACLAKALRYFKLVLHREGYASALRSISKRGIVKLNLRFSTHFTPSPPLDLP